MSLIRVFLAVILLAIGCSCDAALDPPSTFDGGSADGAIGAGRDVALDPQTRVVDGAAFADASSDHGLDAAATSHGWVVLADVAGDVRTLAVDPGDDERIVWAYARQFFQSSATFGISLVDHHTTRTDVVDDIPGGSWQQQPIQFTQNGRVVAFVFSQPDGFSLRYRDREGVWQLAALGSAQQRPLEFPFSSWPPRLFNVTQDRIAMMSSQIFRLDLLEQPSTWRQHNRAGNTPDNMFTPMWLLGDPADPARFLIGYAPAPGRVAECAFASVGGFSCVFSSNVPLPPAEASAAGNHVVRAEPAEFSNLYILYDERLFSSTDRGATLTPLPLPEGASGIAEFALHPTRTGVMAVSAIHALPVQGASLRVDRVWVSEDRGQTYRPIPMPSDHRSGLRGLAIDRQSRIVAAGRSVMRHAWE